MFESLLNAFRAPDIRRRILYVLGILIVFRFLASVPLPGIDRVQLENFLQNNPIFGLLNLFSGGGLARLSIVALGMNPYINASIIMQLMTGVIPSLQALSREGEYGRNRINQYTRYLTVPLAALQAYGFLALLNAQGVLTSGFDLGNFVTVTQIATLTAGAIVLMWLGISIGAHAFPSNHDAKNVWNMAKVAAKEGNLLAVLSFPIVVVLFVANVLRFFWADVIYAYGVGVVLPGMLLKSLL